MKVHEVNLSAHCDACNTEGSGPLGYFSVIFYHDPMFLSSDLVCSLLSVSHALEAAQMCFAV